MSLIKLQEKIGAVADGSFGPDTLKKAMVYFKLSPEHVAHLFGQCSHETGGFHLFSENLNYSATGLKTTFGNYFPGNLADSYARQPIKIANRVYANRMGNGDEASGNGYLYKGAGSLQLTGKDNFQAFSDYLNKPEIMTNPTLVSTDYAFESALFFFERNKLWKYCNTVDTLSITNVSKAINLGSASSKGTPNGLEDRLSLTKRYYSWLK